MTLHQDTSDLSNLPENLHLAILNALPDGLCFSDLKGRILFWSQAAEQISGFTTAEAMSSRKPEQVLSYSDSDGHPIAAPSFELAQTMQQNCFIRHKNGFHLPVQVRRIPLLSPIGAPLGVLDIFTSRAKASSHHELHDVDTTHASGTVLSANELVDMVAHAIHRQEKTAAPAGFLLVKIDNLAEQSRRYGPAAAQRLISLVVETALRCMHRDSWCGQWNDGLILMVLTGHGEAETQKLADRLRSLIKSSQFRWWGEVIDVQVTVGTTLVHKNDAPDHLIRRLERALASQSPATAR
ncbi:MAG: diguanylate cyclase [Acidobacteriota bacterium]